MPSEAVAASSHQTLPPHSPSLAIARVSLATHNRFDAFGDEEADMEDEQDEDGGEEDTEVLQVSPVPVAAHGSQETEDEYIALPKGRTPGAKNKRDELTPDQDFNGQADVSEEGIGLCKTQKTLALSPPAADYRMATSQADSMCFNELKHTTLHVPSSILDTHTRTRGWLSD